MKSTESFETVRGVEQEQTSPAPGTHDFVVANDLNRQRSIQRTYNALTGERTSNAIDDIDPTLQQADVIAELIDQLHYSDIDHETAHIRNASHYSFEPFEMSDMDGATAHASSRMSARTSMKSFKGSRPSSSRYNVNGDSAISLEKEKSKHGSLNSQARDSLPTSEDDVEARDDFPQRPPEPTYPPAPKLALILISLYIGIFLVALDRTIIGPAIPAITNKFKSLDDVGWYGSAYMLTSCGFILIYGRVYTFFSTKSVFLTSIVLFEIGSAICGAATSSMMLIIGRAVAGFGSSGIFTGAILIILEIVPLHRRPLLQGLFGACFGVASVAGPLIGGAFTGSKATWRWCFYINLPLGAITVVVVSLFLKLENKKKRTDGWKKTLKNLDPIGTALFLPSITCLLLALEWGAAEYEWSDPRIIGLLTVFAVLFVAFVAWQAVTRHTTATVPARILFQRSVAFGGLSQFAVGATMLTVSLYIPLWFQAIKDVSAMQSGVRTIPLVLSVVVGSIFSGGAVQKIGYYTPFMIAGSVLMSVGAGLLTTWNTHIVTGMWIGYQVILGLGVGFTMQHPNLAIQIVLPKPDIPTGTALLSLCQTLGGAVFVAVGQNTFINKFTSGLQNINGVDPEKVVGAGATALKDVVPVALQARVLEAYNISLTKGPFFACMIVACLTVPAALGMEWRSVKEDMQKRAQPPASPDKEAPQPLVHRTSAMREEQAGEGDLESLQAPNPHYRHTWRSSYRMVGDYSWVLVKKLNPDLKSNLDSRRQSKLDLQR